MSFGAKESTQQSSGKSFYDPTQTGLVNKYATDLAAKASDPNSDLAYKPYAGPGLSFGNPAALTALTKYQAPKATATGYAPSTVDPSTVANVAPGQIATTDLSKYLNPYTTDVISTTNADMARQGQIQRTADAGQATASGAFGGSRSAVLQSLDDEAMQRTMAATDANLRQTGFTNAQGAAGQDIGTRLQADTTNQAKDLALAQGNQTATNQGLQFGAAANNTASLANQQADIASATQRAQALGMSADQAQAVYGANWAQYLNSQTTPEQIQALITQAYGLIPTSPLQTQSSYGQSVGFDYGAPK